MTDSWRVRRIRSRFAKGLIDSGQGHHDGLRRVYPSEDAALLRVAEDLARIAAKYRIDPEPVAARKGDKHHRRDGRCRRRRLHHHQESSMKLKEYAWSMAGLGDRIEEVLIAQESLQFCLSVYERYASGIEAANEHMDKDRALNQLLGAVARMVEL